MFVKSLFKLMADTQASDLFFTAGAPIQIKINGELMPVNSQSPRPGAGQEDLLRGDDRRADRGVRSRARDQFLDARLQHEHGMLGSFRVNIFTQRARAHRDPLHQARRADVRGHWACRSMLKELVMESAG